MFWGVNVGVAGFAIGLITESAVLKRIFTPLLGVSLLYAVYVFLTAPAARDQSGVEKPVPEPMGT